MVKRATFIALLACASAVTVNAMSKKDFDRRRSHNRDIDTDAYVASVKAGEVNPINVAKSTGTYKEGTEYGWWPTLPKKNTDYWYELTGQQVAVRNPSGRKVIWKEYRKFPKPKK